GRFERAQGAVVEAAQEGAGVVDADLLHLAGEVVLALLDKGFGHGVKGGDAAVEPQRGVDAVREQVTGDAAAGRRHVKAPEALAALRQFGADGPILEELGAVMEDTAEATLVDQLPGERDRGYAAVVVPDHVRHARLFNGLDHLLALLAVHRQRLLAQDHLAGPGGGQGNLRVRVVRRADVDQVNVLAL